MTTSTDERRARAILAACDLGIEWEHASSGLRHSCLHAARAIRESDEAAGMVLVPRKATEGMENAGSNQMNDWDAPDAVWRAMIAAATEEDNG